MSAIQSSPQAPDTVIMVRPRHFGVNTYTTDDNSFQITPTGKRDAAVEFAVYQEATCAVKLLREKGIKIHLFEDTGLDTPDSVFPNNWFSTHPGGEIVLYPMFAPNRRGERRQDIIKYLSDHYDVREVVDYSPLENDGRFLEGTGAIVIDHRETVAYCAISKRADTGAFETWCQRLGYQPVTFQALDYKGLPIYHTNVMMCIGSEIALIDLQSITDPSKRKLIMDNMEKSGRDLIDLTHDQIAAFAGNALELAAGNRTILVLSTTAYQALRQDQIDRIEKYSEIVTLDIPNIELSGGSARCMLAGVHLPPRTA